MRRKVILTTTNTPTALRSTAELPEMDSTQNADAPTRGVQGLAPADPSLSHAVPFILQLPEELLLLILRKVLQGEEPDSPGYFEAITTLRLVHPSWEMIIKNSATFWTTLRCTDTPGFIEASLQRSSPLSLEAHVTCRNKGHGLTTDEVHARFFEALNKANRPCRAFHCSVGRPYEPVIDLITRELPTLEVLEVRTDFRDTLPTIGTAPNLRILRLRNCDMDWVPQSAPSLTRLELVCVSDLELGALLRTLPLASGSKNSTLTNAHLGTNSSQTT